MKKYKGKSELSLFIGVGIATIKLDNEIDFDDCTPISVKDLEYIIGEAKAFLRYRKRRGI